MRRFCVNSGVSKLKSRIGELIPERQARLLEVKQKYGNNVFDVVKVEQVIGGMRDVKCMLWDTSLLDSKEGIKFHGKNIFELKRELQSYNGEDNSEPMTEAMIWYLLTSEIPNKDQVHDLRQELISRSYVSDEVLEHIHSLPKNMHPMSKLTSGIMMLQSESVFAKEYNSGIAKNLYWDPTYEDVLNLIARMPKICSTIYHSMYESNIDDIYKLNHDEMIEHDYAANFCKMLGFDSQGFSEMMRLYLYIHRP